MDRARMGRTALGVGYAGPLFEPPCTSRVSVGDISSGIPPQTAAAMREFVLFWIAARIR
jgi:hypothetical protein